MFLQAYERGVAAIEPLAGFVSFYQGRSKVFETPVLAVTDGLDPKSKAVPLWFSVPLRTLAPGKYDVQVTVAKPGSDKVAFWRAPIVIVGWDMKDMKDDIRCGLVECRQGLAISDVQGGLDLESKRVRWGQSERCRDMAPSVLPSTELQLGNGKVRQRIGVSRVKMDRRVEFPPRVGRPMEREQVDAVHLAGDRRAGRHFGRAVEEPLRDVRHIHLHRQPPEIEPDVDACRRRRRDGAERACGAGKVAGLHEGDREVVAGQVDIRAGISGALQMRNRVGDPARPRERLSKRELGVGLPRRRRKRRVQMRDRRRKVPRVEELQSDAVVGHARGGVSGQRERHPVLGFVHATAERQVLGHVDALFLTRVAVHDPQRPVDEHEEDSETDARGHERRRRAGTARTARTARSMATPAPTA